MGFANKVVMVTGSSSGIGEACARKLLGLGTKVAGVDVRPPAIAHASFTSCVADVTDEPAVRSAVEDAAAAFGRIDGLVTCAGVGATWKPFHQLSVEEWDRVVGINLTGTFLCAKHVAREMIKRREGRIVTIGCVSARIFRPNMADYSASKGGVAALTASMAMDLAPFGIRVNSVAPGVTATAITAKALKDPDARRAYEKAIPLGRVAEPAEIAEAVIFLLDDASGYMTGETLCVDGGFSKAK